jgi:hypothetical protein
MFVLVLLQLEMENKNIIENIVDFCFVIYISNPTDTMG